MCHQCESNPTQRRQFLKTGLAAMLAQFAGRGMAQLPQSLGVPLQSSGDPRLDQYIWRELQWLSSAFGVRAGFAFLQESQGPNAFAEPRSRTVYLGLNLMLSELSQEFDPRFGNYSVVGVLAHEFAHILEFATQVASGNNVLHMELLADFMAGWYMGNRAQFVDTDAQQAMRSLYYKGDYDFNSPAHHGTPEERGGVFVQGLGLVGWPVPAAFNTGYQFITSRFPPLRSRSSNLAALGCIPQR